MSKNDYIENGSTLSSDEWETKMLEYATFAYFLNSKDLNTIVSDDEKQDYIDAVTTVFKTSKVKNIAKTSCNSKNVAGMVKLLKDLTKTVQTAK